MRRGIKGNLTKTGIVCLALFMALGSMGVAYAMWSETVTVAGTVETGEFNSGFTACSTNDPPGTIDPGKDKDVGCATAELAIPENSGYEQVIVSITNAYPCYECQVYVTVQNHGTVPAQIQTVTITSPLELTVTDIDALIGVVLDPGQSVDGTVSVHVEQSALQRHTYTFTVEIYGILWCLGGSQGFWSNWDNHYSQGEVVAWLIQIDDDSEWLGPTTIEGMEAMLAAGRGGTKEEKFLMQYLSLRLDVEAERLYADAFYDFSSYDPGDYLEIGRDGTLQEIIDAIELKYGTSPSGGQFTIMRDICEAIINLWILPTSPP